jgi:hypothetical protein
LKAFQFESTGTARPICWRLRLWKALNRRTAPSSILVL